MDEKRKFNVIGSIDSIDSADLTTACKSLRDIKSCTSEIQNLGASLGNVDFSKVSNVKDLLCPKCFSGALGTNGSDMYLSNITGRMKTTINGLFNNRFKNEVDVDFVDLYLGVFDDCLNASESSSGSASDDIKLNALIYCRSVFDFVAVDHFEYKVIKNEDGSITFDNGYKKLTVDNESVVSIFNVHQFDFEDGKLNSILFSKSNVYVDMKDGTVLRYHKDTNTYEPIGIFDEENRNSGQYGADQMAFMENFDKLINNSLIWEEVQKHYPVDKYKNIDDAMHNYELLFNNITYTGCGFAAATNVIFDHYKGRESEFEKTFGFPMYNLDEEGNIDFNYEVMSLKHFFNEYGKTSINRMVKGQNKIRHVLHLGTHTSAKLGNLGHTSKFLSNYDVDSNVLHEFPYIVESSQNIVPKPVGDDYQKTDDFDEKASLVNDPNNYVVIDTHKFGLYDPDTYELYHNFNGGHYMYVTGMTDDGHAIVSSWGEKYILSDKGLIHGATIVRFD